MATLTNGTGTGGSDENSGKSLAGRVSIRLAEGVAVAANVSRHDFVFETGDSEAATAFGGDLDIGRFRNGTHLQIGLIGGENWRLATPSASRIPRFLTWQTILSRYFPLERERFEAVEPVFRASWGDPNRGEGNDSGFLVTPGLFLYGEGEEPDRRERGHLPIGVRDDFGVREDGVFLQAADLPLLLRSIGMAARPFSGRRSRRYSVVTMW